MPACPEPLSERLPARLPGHPRRLPNPLAAISRLMRHLPPALRRMLLLALLLLPTLGLLLLDQWRSWRQVLQLEHQLQGVTLVRPVLQLSNELQALQLAKRRQTDQPGQPSPEYLRVEQAIAQVDVLNEQLHHTVPHHALSPRWPGLRQQVVQAATATNGAQALSSAIEAVHDTLAPLVHGHQLSMGDDVQRHEMLELALEQLLPTQQALARLDQILAQHVAAGQPPQQALQTQLQLVLASRQLEQQLHALGEHVESVLRDGLAVPLVWQDLASRQAQLLAQLHALSLAVDQGADPTQLWAGYPPLSAEVMASAMSLAQSCLAQVQLSLQAEVRSTLWSAVLRLGLVLAVMALAAWMARRLHVGLQSSIERVSTQIRRVTDGNLTEPVDTPAHDDLARLGQDVAAMSVTLSDMVTEVRTCAVRVNDTGQAMSADGIALGQLTDSQTTALRQTHQTVRQLDGTVNANLDAVERLDLRSKGLGERAEQGVAQMSHGSQMVAELRESVRQVADINAAIDDMAFQTNLLALNAAVEAAKAGEAGRGFSVVAADVRQLAVRCAEAAAQTRNLIDATADRAEQALGSVQQAHQTVRELANGIADVSAHLRSFAGHGTEQRERLGLLRSGLDDLDALCTESGRLAHHAVAAARALTAHSEDLRMAVSAVALRQASAEDARALVESALQHIQQQGWTQAAADFNNPGGPWVGRGMYLYAFDDQDRYLVMGANPDWVGKRSAQAFTRGEGQADDFMRLCRNLLSQAGSGWVEYEGPDAELRGLANKTGFITSLGDGGFIGCSVLRTGTGAMAHLGGVTPMGQASRSAHEMPTADADVEAGSATDPAPDQPAGLSPADGEATTEFEPVAEEATAAPSTNPTADATADLASADPAWADTEWANPEGDATPADPNRPVATV